MKIINYFELSKKDNIEGYVHKNQEMKCGLKKI